jgi:hypothetical protein
MLGQDDGRKDSPGHRAGINETGVRRNNGEGISSLGSRFHHLPDHLSQLVGFFGIEIAGYRGPSDHQTLLKKIFLTIN